MANSREQILLEYAKCIKNTPYALKTYLQTFDNTVSKYVPLELFPDQLKYIQNLETFDENIAIKYRQAGISTVTAAWVSKKISFAKKDSPERILVIANKLDTSIEFTNKIRAFIEQWPSWLSIGFSDEKNSQRHYKLTNGSEVKAVATSKDALRGYTPTVLIIDEAAYIDADSDFWAACMASLSTGGKVIVISTPNGYDPIYYEIYSQSLRGMNEFKISELVWYKDPRYSKDLKLIRTDDIIKYFLEDSKLNNTSFDIIDYSEIPFKERDFDEIREVIIDGYSPTSSWFEGMVRKLKYDKRKISQELECSFIGSGDNVFDSKMLEKYEIEKITDPESRMMGNALWIWKEPIKDHKYIMGIDVSRGDSEDYTTFQIIDFDEKEQVAEYLGKVPPDVIADIAYKWGTMYSCFIVIDITGGMGVSTSRKLQEMGYTNLYFDGVDLNNPWKVNKNMDKVPGLNFNSKRVQIISAFEEGLRYGFTIRSKRLLNEMKTFIYKNGRPDHQKGHHDDLIMSIAMALYVGENSFTKLEKVDDTTKAMIDMWSVETNETSSPHISFDDYVPTNLKNHYSKNSLSRQDYQNYLWLFGGMK